MSDYTPDERIARSMYNLGTQMERAKNGHQWAAKGSSAEFDRFIAKVKADALRGAAEATRAEGVCAGHSGDRGVAQIRRLPYA